MHRLTRLGFFTATRALGLIFIIVVMIAPARSQPAADPGQMITAIYDSYLQPGGGPDDPPNLYSRRLQALIEADRKATPPGDVGHLDFDVFVNGQDWKLSKLRIVTLSRSATRAQVRVNFVNMGTPSELVFDLIFENGAWRIDEVRSVGEKGWTLSDILTPEPKTKGDRGR